MDRSIPEAAQTRLLVSESTPDLSSSVVLCVDDESNVLRALRRLLRREPYSVLFADSGSEALALLEETPIDLVVSDQRMPGMSGTELLRQVKQRFPDTVRVILSGYAEVSAIVDSINEGEIYRFLAKPWNDEQLKTSVRQCLEHHDLVARNKLLLKRVRRQNEELCALNARLEELVEERTFSLRLSQEVLARVPIPVVGISTEGLVVLVNESVGSEFPSTSPVCLGVEARDVLPEAIFESVEVCLSSGERHAFPSPTSEGGQGTILKIEPLMDADAVRGCLLILTEGAHV